MLGTACRILLLLAFAAGSAAAGETPDKAAAETGAENENKEGPVFSPEVEAILNEASGPEGYGATERCIQVRSIRDSRVLDDRHVVFELSGKRYYLVQFQRSCHQLRRNSSIAYEPRGSQLCRLDDIHAIIDFRVGGIGPPCPIPGFYEVSVEQVTLLDETLKAAKQAEIDAYRAEKARRKAER